MVIERGNVFQDMQIHSILLNMIVI